MKKEIQIESASEKKEKKIREKAKNKGEERLISQRQRSTKIIKKIDSEEEKYIGQKKEKESEIKREIRP